VQLLVPLHHHLLVRDSAWTNDGFDFAWKVMVAEKTGSVRFHARERATGRKVSLEPARALTAAQTAALARERRLIVDFARCLARDVRSGSGRQVAVFADAFATLNGRPAQRLIAPDVDLTREPTPVHAVVPLANR
jgi:vitamin K-dependent gamma-carboxylase